MKIEVNITKKYFFILLAIVFILAGIIAVYAVWDTAKTVYHPGTDVKVNIGGVDYSLQEAINQGRIGSGGVNKIIAGSGIVINPVSGTGDVGVSVSLGGGVSCGSSQSGCTASCASGKYVSSITLAKNVCGSTPYGVGFKWTCCGA